MAEPLKIAGIVLAGGRATRMGGGDKTLAEIGGRPMLDRIVLRLTPQVGALAINANGDPDRFERLNLPVVADAVPDFAGPLAGILAGLFFARENGARFLATVAGDTPFFPADLVSRLSEASGEDEETIAVAASATGVHPVFGLWPAALAPALETFLREGSERKIMAFAERYFVIRVPFDHIDLDDGEIDPFFNVNTPDDRQAADRFATALDRQAGTSLAPS